MYQNLIKYSLFLVVLFLGGLVICSCTDNVQVNSADVDYQASNRIGVQGIGTKVIRESRIVDRFRYYVGRGDSASVRKFADSLESGITRDPDISYFDLANAYYCIGLSYSLYGLELKSFPYFEKALESMATDTANPFMEKIYYNLGYAYNKIDDHVKSDYFFSKSLRYALKEGNDTLGMITDILSLAIANDNLSNHKRALTYINKAFELANQKPGLVDGNILSTLYQEKGVSLNGLSDYSLGLHNLNISLQYYTKGLQNNEENYLNLLNNLAASNYNVGNNEKCLEVYEMGLEEAAKIRSFVSYMFIRNYSSLLAKLGKKLYGEKLLREAVRKIMVVLPENPNKYYEALAGYADYLREHNIDKKKALALLKKCYEYVNSHAWNINLRNQVSLAYSMALLDNNMPVVALDSINSVINRNAGINTPSRPLLNPEPSALKPDKKTLDLIRTKYLILDRLPGSDSDTAILMSKARTAELIIDLLETIRLNIGEEESRLILGGKHRDAYFDAIQCYDKCFGITGNHGFLNKAFSMSERSKAASLLASMRENRAMKAAIPEDKIIEEKELQKEISFYESKFEEVKNSEHPDVSMLNFWEKELVAAVEKKASLTAMFERKYPGYSTVRTNTVVLDPHEVMNLIGMDKDYLSYVVSDSAIYIFLVNRKGSDLIRVRIDTSFASLVKNFRKLLSEPNLHAFAGNEFRLFQTYGYKLYSLLFKPVADRLVTDNLVISTDNFLSYFPFETLVTDEIKSTDLYYSRLPYLMNKFRISYVYSATLLSESGRINPSIINSSVSFAPSYQEPIIIDSLSVNRQQNTDRLPDLVFAREEAQFVSRITSGRLFPDTLATKVNYLKNAGKYDIIHLAMHTVLNTKNPGSSGMIFYDSITGKNRYLQPYEINAARLIAKMVVLSSCYTGAGTLYTGEGVLSLARGFISSGSHSVVMSLWEINDRSGTTIIKEFYRKLKSGLSKSEALREARLSYLKKADMLRSHPYFWSTLVIYGDDSPIYLPSYQRLLIIFLPACLIGLIGLYYFRKRR